MLAAGAAAQDSTPGQIEAARTAVLMAATALVVQILNWLRARWTPPDPLIAEKDKRIVSIEQSRDDLREEVKALQEGEGAVTRLLQERIKEQSTDFAAREGRLLVKLEEVEAMNRTLQRQLRGTTAEVEGAYESSEEVTAEERRKILETVSGAAPVRPEDWDTGG
jgi:chromosome segregation ATPase